MAEAGLAVASHHALEPHHLQRKASAEGFIVLTDEMIRGSIYPTNRSQLGVAALRTIQRATVSRFYRTRNAILDSVFPSSGVSWYVAIGITVGTRHYLPAVADYVDSWFPFFQKVQEGIPREVVAVSTIASISWAVGTWISRWMLQGLLMYKGYMFAKRGERNYTLIAWGSVMTILKGFGTPRMYSYQNVLPCLPVPSLRGTCERYLASARPLLDEPSFDRMERLADDFCKNEGWILQLILWGKSWVTNNYVSDWWEKFVYLRSRTRLMIASNYYCMDAHAYVPTNNQVARAANLLYNMLEFKELIEEEKMEPKMVGPTPLCMLQYYRLFGTTRIPGFDEDRLQHVRFSKHVVVFCKGNYYIFNIFDEKKRKLNARDYEKQFQEILDDASKQTKNHGEKLAAMTGVDRTVWAEFRENFMRAGVNRASLEAIERAALLIVLDDESPDFPEDTLNETNPFAHQLFHGNGANRWFDKSIQFIVFANGRAGINAEHSWADAPVVGHLYEQALADEFLGPGYDRDTRMNKPPRTPMKLSYKKPVRLRWSFPDEALEEIEEAVQSNTEMIEDLDLIVARHDAFSKGLIKKCKISPDAFFQMALQLAYYRDAGHFAQTYEASMTRLYREGRTETVRPVSDDSCAFVRLMCDEDSTVEDRVTALRKACDSHVNRYKLAMVGKGVDRHLFCLYIASKWMGYDCEFLQEVLSVPWSLSTSQTPAQQTGHVWEQPNRFSGGGGFGPVAENGYGVSYIISSNDLVFFHISSNHHSEQTNSSRFAKHIFAALKDMKDTCVAADPSIMQK